MSDQKIDESIYTRVSSVLNEYSGLSAVPKNILDYAKDRGTRVHSYCEKYALDQLNEEIDEDCFNYVQAFAYFADMHLKNVILQEMRFFCDDLKIQGQCDLICDLKDKKNVLIDIKTSLKPSKNWNIQTAAYKYLSDQSFIEFKKDKILQKIEHRYVLHLKKDQTFDLIQYAQEDYTQELEIFKKMLDVYRYYKKS